MKKLLLMCLLAGTLTGCSEKFYDSKYSLGMTEQEFKNANRSAKEVYGNKEGMSIYRTINFATELPTFYRFEKSKLVEFQEGIYLDDYKNLIRN